VLRETTPVDRRGVRASASEPAMREVAPLADAGLSSVDWLSTTDLVGETDLRDEIEERG
jgi:hypothetical protein